MISVEIKLEIKLESSTRKVKDFPDGAANLLFGSSKLHENEENLLESGWRRTVRCTSALLNPPL